MIRFLLFMLMILVPMSAKAEEFGTIPVLHDGRIKPMDSFARIHLKLFSGSERIDRMNAQEWLLETLFNPPQAFNRPVFKINDPDVRQILGLEKRAQHMYALSDISAPLEAQQEVIQGLLDADQNTFSRSQRALIDLHIHRILYSNILRSLSLVVPLSIQPPNSLGLEEKETYTALDFERIAQKAENKVKDIVRQKGDDIEKFSDEEIELAQFMMQMSVLREASSANVLLRIIPPQWNESEEWMSPWVLIQSGQGSPQSSAYLDLWKNAAIAYKAQDETELNTVFAEIYDSALTMMPDDSWDTRLKAEVFYNHIHPFHVALGLFAIAVVACAAYAMKPIYLFYYGALATSIGGLFFTTFGIVIRMLVLDRPPVGTLFESVLFVTTIVALFALLSEWRYKNALSLFGGALTSVILISISSAMAINPDDKEVLVAVLDTNFWLATHVLIVTAGYGTCLLAAIGAHIHMGVEIAGKNTRSLDKNITQAIYLCAIISLLLMSVGTILGGVWADQSWGRFWGWDPKENGALLIVLWLVWILHGKISGHLKQWDVSALYAYLGVIVALSWFGVNLLNVGLHSYGFIDGIAYGLVSFIVIETLLIGGAYIVIQKQDKACAQT
ncbi:MAG: cytochrome c biogenesis protein CcsA [Pseudomonadota bacterium]